MESICGKRTLHIDADTLANRVAGASVVLCRHLDAGQIDSRLATERAVRFEPPTVA